MFKNYFGNNLRRYIRCYGILKNFNIHDILQNTIKEETISIKGWIKSLRKMKDHIFIDVNDGSCSKNLQVLVQNTHKIDRLTTGASVYATGALNLSPKGHLELHANKIEVYGECNIWDGYPFAPRKFYDQEYVRQHLHFRPRTNKFSSLLRIRDSAMQSIHQYLHDANYIHITTPILTSNDSEGAGEIFSVLPSNPTILKDMKKSENCIEDVYFDTKVYLTVSGQLHLECVAHGLTKVYTFGPTFRAENSKSRLHLSEFYMLEVEQAFIDKLEDVMNIIEKLLKNITETVINKGEEDIIRCREEVSNFNWLQKPFIVLTYKEAASILEKNKKQFTAGFNVNRSFTKEHENFLVNYCGDTPTFIINWPKNLKPFYMKNCIDNNSQVSALDLLVPGIGELVGGSLREDNYDILRQKLPKGNTDLNWYLDIKKHGRVPTGGFGLGFERYLQFLLGISNIKDVIPFPRWPHNCKM